MEKQLKIKFKNQQQSFEILEDEISIHLNTAKHKLKYTIPLDDIKNNWHVESGGIDKVTNGLHVSIFINVFLVLLIISLSNHAPPLALQMLGILSALPFVLMIRNITEAYEEKHIGSSKIFYFIYKKKNAEEVDAFIKLVYQKQIEFFRRKYFLLDPVLPYNVQYERYLWLYNGKYINENEYEVIKADLDKYFNFNPII